MGRWQRLLVASASLAALLCTYAPGFTVPPVAAAQPPNIVVLMVDDLAVMDDRLFNVLPTIKSTFLQHGARFTDYYGNDPLCCPGRTNFLTGQFSHHTGVTVNDARLFDPRESLATELQGLGYQNFIVGKYLNEINRLTSQMPPGWTKAFVNAGSYWGRTYWRNGNSVTYPANTYSTDLFANIASGWISGANPNQPIFAFLTPFAPHEGSDADGTTPVEQPSPPPRYVNDQRCKPPQTGGTLSPWNPPNYAEADRSDKPAWVSNFHAAYPDGWPLARTCGAMLAVDDELAKVKAAMTAAGRTNTIYVLTGDNGMAWGAHGIDGKAVPYATPLPLFIRWDSQLGTGQRTIPTTVENVDMAPTLCALVGCQMGPYPNGFGVDGLSFAPVLLGTATTTGRQNILEEMPAGVDGRIPRWAGVRTTNENSLGRWVYTEYETGDCELYDLTVDPWELDNRCDSPVRPVSQTAPEHQAQLSLATALHDLRHDSGGAACTSTCYVDAYNGDDSNGGTGPKHAKQHIQAAIDAVNPGGTVRVMPGHYREQATNRSPSGGGTFNFGLFVPASKAGISIVGVDPVDQPITDPAATRADITTIGDASFGPVGVYIDAPHVTIKGLSIKGNLDPGPPMAEHDGMTLYIAANDFTLKNSQTVVPGGGSVWFDDPNSAIASYHIIGNRFPDGTAIEVTNHTGTTGTVAGREIKGNAFDLRATAQPGIEFDGNAGGSAAAPFNAEVGGAIIANNTFTGTVASIRARGTVVNADFDWSSWFANNTFDGAVMVGDDPMGDDLTSYPDTCGSDNCSALQIGATIQRQIDRANPGDTVLVGAGTYNESPDIPALLTSLTLKSLTGRNNTTIALDAPGPSDLGALTLEANNVTVDGFTIVGRDGTPSQTANANIVVAEGLNSVTIQNNRFKVGEINITTPNGDEGIGIVTTNPLPANQFVDTLRIWNNIFQPLHASAYRAWFVKPGVTNLSVSGNVVTGTFDAFALVQATAGTVSNNTIVGSGSSASIGALGSPDPDHYGQTTFQGNDISGTSAGIVVRDANDVTITNNTIHGIVNGVVLDDTGNYSAALVGSSVHVNNNSITGASDKLLVNEYAGPVDASGNWWGTKAEASIDAATMGPVDFTPFLDRGTDVGAAHGFQGDQSTVHATALGSQTGTAPARRLDEAVDLVDPSGTVMVGPGNFVGDITVAKSVNFQGAQFGDAVAGRQPPADPSSESVINGTITLAAPNILVDGFWITETNDPAYGVVVRAAGSGATISHDVFDGITSAAQGVKAEAISLQNAPDNVTITDNRIANVSGSGPTGGIVIDDVGGPAASSNIDIERNVIKNVTSTSGAYGVLDNNSNDAQLTIWNNTIMIIIGDVVHAIAFEGPASVADVRGNTINNLTAAAASDQVAVWFEDDDALGDATVRRNSLDVGPDSYGIAVGTSSPPVGSVDGACNWWGDPSGPGAVGTGSGSKVTTNVISNLTPGAPWLVGTDLAGNCDVLDVGTPAPDAIGNEGQTLTSSGSFATTSGTPPTITANNAAFGTFTDNGNGTWSWSYLTTDDVQARTITVRATDLNGSRAVDRFVYRAANVAPTATFQAAQFVPYGTHFQLKLASAMDASSADVSAQLQFAFDCGDGNGFSTPSTSVTATCVAPSEPGDITVQGQVIDKDGGKHTYSQVIHITQPAITVTPVTAGFGVVGTGGGRHSRTFVVTNVGTAPLTVSDTHLSGDDPTQFSIMSDACSGVPITVNRTCTISVAFAPTSDDPMSASLVIDSNDPHLPSVTAALSGTGAEVGAIRITLVARPKTTADPFSFTGTGGFPVFSLPAKGSFVRVLDGLLPGSYTITESALARWPLIGLSCTTGQTIDLAHRSVTVQVQVGKTVDCTFVNSRRLPDAMIAKAPNGPFAGVNVFSGTPLDRQRARQVVPPGTVKTFWVTVQNDGLDPDSFGLAATYSGAPQFQVKVWRGSVDITARVLAGTFSLANLPSGGKVNLHVTVSATTNIPLTSTGSLIVRTRSLTAPAAVDVVEADVTAK